ncbi:MAG: FHA domain-containing protein, partial [Blastocatellia bacterium]
MRCDKSFDMAANKFIIIRNDLDIYPVILETEGLTIGRLTGNDIVLNHPTVSRTHAGIKEVDGDYWIFNLSNANGTLLNGELVESAPLADGDLIQIGPFFLRPTYTNDYLSLEVEMSVKPLPIVVSGTGALHLRGEGGEAGKTMMLDQRLLAQREKSTPKGTKRLSNTGFDSGVWPSVEDQALKVFWDKRKREVGKWDTESPLRPKVRRRFGKARLNWRSTRDLDRAWSVAIPMWSALIVAALSVTAAFTFKDVYSPGVLSAAHARDNFLLTPAIAREPNSASCATCHSSKATMRQNCASCHTTRAFDPAISETHNAAGLTCVACHNEHKGRDFRPALVANTGCTSCHQDGMVSHGKQLRTPHGGTLGYPVSNGRWEWAGVTQEEWKRKGLRGSKLQYNLTEQFHLVHVAGRRQGRAKCSDCHTAGYEGEAVRQGVRESCATCHAVNYQV